MFVYRVKHPTTTTMVTTTWVALSIPVMDFFDRFHANRRFKDPCPPGGGEVRSAEKTPPLGSYLAR